MLRARLPFDGGRNHEEEKMLWRIVKSRPRYDQHWRPATLDDLRECVETLVDLERRARRVFGGAHPNTAGVGASLQDAQAALRARETPSRRA